MSAKVPQTLRQASNTEKLRRRTIVELAIGFMRQKEKDVGN
jgi:hypothetical protein